VVVRHILRLKQKDKKGPAEKPVDKKILSDRQDWQQQQHTLKV
jgi:hypothetical protein